MDEQMKGTVKHKLTMLKTHPPVRPITQRCILDHCEPDINEPWYAAQRLQLSIRCQYYRLIEKYPDRALDLTYALNCPPSGFQVTPYTHLCQQHRVCPWCFARRLVKIYDALMKPEPEVRKSQKLLMWRRQVPASGKIPLFRPDRGPHTWLKAAVTVQIVVPYFNDNTKSFQLKHVGLQLIQKSEKAYARKLTRNCVNPSLDLRYWPAVTPTNVFNALQTTMRFPWLPLYLGENLDHFEKLIGMYPKQKLLRISHYKSKMQAAG